jgi:hypothetical protein
MSKIKRAKMKRVKEVRCIQMALSFTSRSLLSFRALTMWLSAESRKANITMLNRNRI